MKYTARFLAPFFITAFLTVSLSAQEHSTPACVQKDLTGVWSIYLFSGSHTASAAYLRCTLTIEPDGSMHSPNPANPNQCYADFDPFLPIPITDAFLTVTTTSTPCVVIGNAFTNVGSFTIEHAQMSQDLSVIHGVGKDNLNTPTVVHAVRTSNP